MTIDYIAASGILTSLTIINSDDATVALAAASWDWDAVENVQDAPGMGRGGFVDHAPGLKRSVIMASGTWNISFNPFVTAPTLKLGQTVTVQLGINGSISAEAPNAIVSRWHVHAEVDGKVDWECTLIADGSFDDFSNTAA